MPRPSAPQRGFTLFKLVTVIVFLGVLTAVALQKHMSVDTDAHIPAEEQVAGAVRSAAYGTSIVRTGGNTGSVAITDTMQNLPPLSGNVADVLQGELSGGGQMPI